MATVAHQSRSVQRRSTLLGRAVDRLLALPPVVVPRVSVDADLQVPMPDGVLLAADRYHDGSGRPAPVVLIRTPYGKTGPLGRLYAHAFARRGFQLVVQDVRGVFGSQGTFRAFHQEQADGLATAAWLRGQPWCDGRLAMVGASYLGHTQWAVGPYLDPPLVAMGMAISGSTFIPTFYPGGQIAVTSMVTWSAQLGTQESRFALLPHPLRARRINRAMGTLPLSEADTAAIGQQVPFLREVVAHAGPGDDFWSDTAHDRALADFAVPTTMVAGWYDLFLPQQLRDFTTLQRQGVTTRLTVGPWRHGELGSLGPILSDQLSFLQGLLLGDKAALQRAPVRLFLQGAGRWLDFDRWPVAATNTPFFLAGDGRLGAETPVTAATRSFVYDPLDPTPVVGGAVLTNDAQRRDNAAVEARADVLVYTGAPLARALDVIGEVRATVFARTGNADADLFVRLCDVDPQGRSMNVCDGLLRLRPDAPAADVDGIRRVEVELFPTAYRFLAGHRIRVQLAGGAFPLWARNLGLGEPDDQARRSRPGTTEIQHGAAHPTRIELPVFQG